MADRYAYVPLIGIFIILSWGAASVFTHWRIPETIMATVAILLLTTCGLVARSQLACWKNTETLFKHAAAVTPNNFLAYSNLGYYFAGKGQTLEAMKYYRAAIKINPAIAETHKNLGIVLERTGQLNEAVEEYNEGIRLAPQNFGVHFDLGCVYVDLGNRDKAIEQFKEVLRLKPGFELAELRLQQLGVLTNQTNLPYPGK
jgi:protein O-mannosyl-transferase